jgi:hypothetical protein
LVDGSSDAPSPPLPVVLARGAFSQQRINTQSTLSRGAHEREVVAEERHDVGMLPRRDRSTVMLARLRCQGSTT